MELTLPSNLENLIKEAIKHFWITRNRQSINQAQSGRSDQGARSAVTGGKQMDGFSNLFRHLMILNGIQENEIFTDTNLELPGFYRPTKKWDIVVVRDHNLIATLELKSQVGPSFGNNFNNRTEEALGSSIDIWKAYSEGAINASYRPWLGYLMLLEDCNESRSNVRVAEPHFNVFSEFRNSSYAKRYELFCRKLMRENNYTSTCFLMSSKNDNANGGYTQIANDLTINLLIRSLLGHIISITSN